MHFRYHWKKKGGWIVENAGRWWRERTGAIEASFIHSFTLNLFMEGATGATVLSAAGKPMCVVLAPCCYSGAKARGGPMQALDMAGYPGPKLRLCG